MSELAHEEPAAHAGLTEFDLCRRCGYCRGGVRADGVCPECGQPAAWSVGKDLLINADPGMVRRLRRGLPLLHAVLALTLLWLLTFAHLSWAIWAKRPGVAQEFRLSMAAGVALAALFVLAVFGVTPEDPGADEADRGVRAKARRAACTAVVLAGVCGAVAALGLPAAWSSSAVGRYVPLAAFVLVWWPLHDAMSATAGHVRFTALRVPLDIDRSFRVASAAGWASWLLVLQFFVKEPTVNLVVREVVVGAYAAAVVISLVNVERVRRGVARVADEQARRAREGVGTPA